MKGKKNEINELIDDTSLIVGTAKAGTILSTKIAKEQISETKRYKVSDKIGKLLKEISQGQ